MSEYKYEAWHNGDPKLSLSVLFITRILLRMILKAYRETLKEAGYVFNKSTKKKKDPNILALKIDNFSSSEGGKYSLKMNTVIQPS